MEPTKLNRSSNGILIALSVLMISTSAAVAAAATNDGSVDSMWMDQSQTVKSTESTSTPAPATTTSAAVVDENTIAPMCTLETFKNSTILSKGGWPGVGPFKPDVDNDFFDDHHNKIHVDVSGNQITRAELALKNRQSSGNAEKDLLDMQMHIDFLLEAVGIKAAKIQELNADLAKNKEILLATDGSPLNLKIGRCSVTIEKKPGVDGGKLDYLIAVNSLDANQQVLKQHASTETPIVPAIPSITAPSPTAVTKPTKPVAKPATTTAAAPVSDSALKTQFAALINEWQRVKKGAVRNRQTEELATVLAGKALIRQSDAVKWLVTNHKYYDMSPKGVVVDQFAELAPAKKYMVSAQVHEAYKFIDEGSGKVLKEVDDINKVNYTVEKIAGKWVITDSALLAPPSKINKASTNKTTR